MEHLRFVRVFFSLSLFVSYVIGLHATFTFLFYSMKRGVFPGYCYDLLMTLHHTGVSCGTVFHLHIALRDYIGYYLAFCIAVATTHYGVKVGKT